MAKTRTQQTITSDSLRSLSHTDPNKRKIVWKEFGVYLDKKVSIHTDADSANRSAVTSLGLLPSTEGSYLSQNINFKICNSCGRPIGEQSLSTHYQKCVEMKQKRRDDDSASNSPVKRKKARVTNSAILDIEDTSVDSSRNSTPLPSTPTSSGVSKPKKKYKKSQTQKEKEAANAAALAAMSNSGNESNPTSAGTANSGLKRKKKQKPKSTGKVKGPVDVEKQCGVPLPSGGFCARSLTCKTHSMGAKRAVPGRSAPYDVLLQQYQKRNQAKLAANNALAAQQRENEAFNGSSGSNVSMNSNGNFNKILDHDEETQLVLEGLSKNNPVPLERKVIMPVRHRHRFLAMREAYANALVTLGGNSTAQSNQQSNSSDSTLANQAISGSIGGLQGRCALINVDNDVVNSESPTQTNASISGEMYQVRAPSKAILMTSQYNVMQQQLFQQQVMKMQQQQQQQQQMLLMKQRQSKAQGQVQQQSQTTPST